MWLRKIHFRYELVLIRLSLRVSWAKWGRWCKLCGWRFVYGVEAKELMITEASFFIFLFKWENKNYDPITTGCLIFGIQIKMSNDLNGPTWLILPHDTRTSFTISNHLRVFSCSGCFGFDKYPRNQILCSMEFTQVKAESYSLQPNKFGNSKWNFHISYQGIIYLVL